MIDYIVSSLSAFFSDGRKMYPIFIVLIVGIIIQLTKVIVDLIKHKRFYRGHVLSSGGFPSFHSGLGSSVTMLVLLHQGFGSVLFAVSFCFGILFAYDAMNLRYEAGQHALYINDLRVELQNVLVKKEKSLLKERIGHTPLEVMGGILFGTILTFILYYLVYIK
ncbi:MAG: divergent PAP2 family protein [Candidatus Absconditabacterales bacterium]